MAGGEDMVKFEEPQKTYFSSEPEEITTVMNGKVIVSRTGNVTVIKNKDVKKEAEIQEDRTTEVKKRKTVKAEIAEADSSSNDTTGHSMEGKTVQDDSSDSGDGDSEMDEAESDDNVDKDSDNDDVDEDDDDDDDDDENSDLDDDEFGEALSDVSDDSDDNLENLSDDDNEELQFESDSDESKDSTSNNDMKNLEHIRSLWEGGNDAELDSDQVSDTSISENEEINGGVDVKSSNKGIKTGKHEERGKKPSNIRPVKQSKKMSKVTVKEVTVKASKRNAEEPMIKQKETIKERNVKLNKKEILKDETVKQKEVTKERKDKQRKKEIPKEKTVKESKKETPKEETFKQSKKETSVKARKKIVKETEVTQAPPVKRSKLSDGKSGDKKQRINVNSSKKVKEGRNKAKK